MARPFAVEPPSPPTTIGEQLAWATQALASIDAPDPGPEAARLLALAMGLTGLPAHPNAAVPMAASQVDRFLAAIARRLRQGQQKS